MLTRPAPPPDRVVRYGDLPEHVADVYGGAGPLVIFLHGGFWMAEYDRTHTRPLAADLAGRGYTVALPEYRRVGQAGGGWPGTGDDVAAAVGAVPGLLGHRGPVVLAGHSAGGHLALWAAATGPAYPVLALAPVCDLGLGFDLDLDGGAVRRLLGGGPDDVPERYAAADPMALPAVARAVLVHGDADDRVPIEMSRRYAAAQGAELVELPGVEHFALIDPLSAAWPVVVAALAHLAPAGPGPATMSFP